MLLNPARVSDAQPSETQAPHSVPSIDSRAEGTTFIHALRATATTVPGVISSSVRHWNIGTPATDSRHSRGWLAVPWMPKPSFVVSRLVGWTPELKTRSTRTGLPSLSSTSKSASRSLFGGRSTKSW